MGVALRLAGLASIALLLVLAGFRTAAWLRESEPAAAVAPAHGRFVATPFGQMHLIDEGPRQGKPVVLIHGTAAWGEFWRGTIDYLTAGGWRVIAIDLPPFGFSERNSDGRYPRADQAGRIKGVLDALGISRALLIGHSFGGGATVETAMRHPDRVNGLVMIAPALGLPEEGGAVASPPASMAWLTRQTWLTEPAISATATNPLLTRRLLSLMLARKERALEDYADILRRPMGIENSTPDFARWLEDFLAVDRDAWSNDVERYRRLDLPVGLIWGDQDALTPLPQGRRLAQLVPGARLAVISGVGHIPQIEDPPAFRPLLDSALAFVSKAR